MPSSLFPKPRHDHDACIADGLARAEAVCRDRGERLTANRRQVLEILLAEHRPAGAYDILERFDWTGRRPAPVQIYRALAFLESMGLAHRIASRNAYVACSGHGEGHGTVFLVCERCGTVAEPSVAGLHRTLRELAGESRVRPALAHRRGDRALPGMRPGPGAVPRAGSDPHR